MAAPLAAQFAPDLDLGVSYTVRLTALDPTTGNLVSGVKISGVSIFGDAVSPDIIDQPQVPETPLFVPVPVS